MKLNSFKIPIIFLCAFIYATNCIGKADLDMAQALEYMKLIGQMKSYSYNYIVKNRYPNGKVDNTNGKVFLDVNKMSIAEKGTFSTTLITPSWYYKAEHNDKSINIIDLDVYYKKNKNAPRIDKFFDSKSMMIPDSIFNNYGKVQEIVVKNDIVKIRVKFNKLSSLDIYEVVLDKKKKQLISTYTKTYTSSYKGILTQEVFASNFSPIILSNCFDTQILFEVKNKKIILKQYKNYKPHFEL